jgi:hypothetical protein
MFQDFEYRLCSFMSFQVSKFMYGSTNIKKIGKVATKKIAIAPS